MHFSLVVDRGTLSLMSSAHGNVVVRVFLAVYEGLYSIYRLSSTRED